MIILIANFVSNLQKHSFPARF